MCLCPFHHEKTPSFSISSKKQIWKCFSCGKGGDVISLVQEFLSCNAYEAAKHINEIFRLGVDFRKSKTNKYDISLYEQKRNAKIEFETWLNTSEDILSNYYKNIRNVIVQAKKIDIFDNMEFVEACMNKDKIEAWLDIIQYGTDEDKIWFYKTYRKEVDKIKWKIQNQKMNLI
jgi:DNA primase